MATDDLARDDQITMDKIPAFVYNRANMKRKLLSDFSHQFTTALSFGVTSGVITALGMIIGLDAATSSKLAVAAGIIIVAVADGLSDATAIHVAEESEVEKGEAKHTHVEVWLTTIFLFLIECSVRLTFTIPILFFPLQTAVLLCIAWGMFLLVLLNFYTAKIKNENPLQLIAGHLSLALFVIAISYLLGRLVSVFLK